MGDVLVTGGRISDGRITSLAVELHGLPGRTIDRELAITWLRDGHSLIPRSSGIRGTALQLVEVGDAWFVRHDNAAVPHDSLPAGLPT
jgi:hypothetical protein